MSLNTIEPDLYKKGKVIIFWKTKDINKVKWKKELVIMTNNNNVSAWDWVRIETAEWVADYSTTITSNVFEYLNNKWIKTHFKERLSNSEILVEKCDMVPVECVFRFVATGSFIDREQAIKADEAIEDGTILDKPVIELYYKNDVITKKWKRIADPMILLWDNNRPVLDDDFKLVLLNPKTWKRLKYEKAYEAWTDKTISKKDFEIESFNIKSSALELLKKTKEAWEWIKELYSEVWLDVFDGKVEFWQNSKWEIILADVIDGASCRIKIPYIVEWKDWKTYLVWDFMKEELDWVWWYDSSYFEKLDVIPTGIKIKKVILAEWLDKQWFREWGTAENTVSKFKKLAEKSDEALSKAGIDTRKVIDEVALNVDDLLEK